MRRRRTPQIASTSTTLGKSIRLLIGLLVIAITGGVCLYFLDLNKTPVNDQIKTKQQASQAQERLSISDSFKVKVVDKVMEMDGFTIPSSSSKLSGSKTEGYDITQAQLESFKKNINREDKVKAYNIVYQSLSGDDFQRLLILSQGDYTPEKKTEAKQLLTSGLTEQDIEELTAIYAKYQ